VFGQIRKEEGDAEEQASALSDIWAVIEKAF